MGEKGNAYRNFAGKTERDHREDPGADGRKKLKRLLKERENETIVWIGLIWLAAGISGELLCIWSGNSGFHKIQGIS
jgi:hypothetical protein